MEGPVAVCIDRPVLSLDRPFTYLLPPELDAGVGSLVQVPFHGRLIRGWVLGPSESFGTRMLGVKKVVSPVRFFDEDMLELLRWVSERYVAPLAAVIGRAVPPRVASEESSWGAGARRGGGGPAPLAQPSHAPLRGAAAAVRTHASSSTLFSSYRNGAALSAALDPGAGRSWFGRRRRTRLPLPSRRFGACLDGGRRAIVLVPEAVPVPATAAGIVEAFGERVAMLVGGDKRARYRTWLEIADGRFDVVVGTRPAVFAPLTNVGVIVVSRESHAAHREDRAPYYHVRDVAVERAELDGARLRALRGVSVVRGERARRHRRSRHRRAGGRRWRWCAPVRRGARRDWSARSGRRIAASSSRRCRATGWRRSVAACGRPAACAACGGALRSEEGTVRCIVCEAPGRCAHCGAADFGLRRGGAERVEEWASTVAPVPVRRVATRGRARLPKAKEILVGGPESVRDLGPGDLELVAILDADLAERRPGLASRERALATWMEAVGWARPSGRAIVQADRPSDPAIQALVRGNPDRFHADEAARREAAGFPVGSAVFRIAGSDALEAELADVDPITMLVSSVGGQTVCLLALEPGRVEAFGRTIRDLAARDIVERVEAEPHL